MLLRSMDVRKIMRYSNSRVFSRCIFYVFLIALCHGAVSLRAKGSRRAQAQKGVDLTTKQKDKKGKTLTLKGLKSVLRTEADDEFSSSSNSTLDQELFQAANEYQLKEALHAENQTLAYMNSTGQEVPLPTFPFIICNEAQNISGYQRYNQISAFGPTYTEALLNSNEFSCWFVHSTASNASSVVQQNENLSLTAVGPYAKIRKGTISAIQFEGAKEFLVQLCPGALKVSGPHPPIKNPLGAAAGSGAQPLDSVGTVKGSGPELKDPVHTDISMDMVWKDILSSLKGKANMGGTRKLMHQRSHVTEKFYWTHLLERTEHLANKDRDLRQQIPRATMWARALQEGIDSSHHCSDMFDALHMSPLEDGNSFRLQVGGSSDVGSGSIRNQQDSFSPSISCTLSLIAGVSSHPSVCSVVNAPIVKLSNHEAAWIVQSGQYNERPWFDAGIRGRNQIVAIADTGIDSNHCYFSDGIPFQNSGVVDFSRRKVIQYKGVDNLDSLGGHGTHTAATIAGAKANGYGKSEGIARDAKLVFFDISDDSNMTHPNCCKLPRDWTKLLNNSYINGTARVQSFSWGAVYNQYHVYDQWMDSFVYNNPDFVIVTAAGNNGTQYGVGSPAVAKNVITVGSTFSAGSDINSNGPDMHYLSTFSARGPTADGRIKPDVVAPGEWILSAMARPDLASSGKQTCDPETLPMLGKSDEGLMFDRGTSMATPVVSGTVALIRQYFEEGWHINGTKNKEAGFSPSAALVKAILINGAQQLLGIGNVDGNVKDYDYNQGFGRINLHNTVPFRNNNISLLAGKDGIITNGEVHNSTIYTMISNNCTFSSLTVSLVWTDPPAAAACSSCVLNDLDLSLVRVNDGTTFYPNGLSTKDSLNNAERIRLNVTVNETYIIQVEGSNLSTESQSYALVASGCFKLLPKRKDNGRNSAGTVDSLSEGPPTTKPVVVPPVASSNASPVSTKVTPLPVALESVNPLTSEPASTIRPIMFPAARAPIVHPVASTTVTPVSIKVTPLPVTLETKKPLTRKPARTNRPTILPTAREQPNSLVIKVTSSPVDSASKKSPSSSNIFMSPMASSSTTQSSTDKPISSGPQNYPYAAMIHPIAPNSAAKEKQNTLFSHSNNDFYFSFSSNGQLMTATGADIPNSASSLATFHSDVSKFLADSTSRSIEMYNVLTDSLLCEGTAADIAQGHGCNELPSGVPIKIVIIDPTTGLATATKIITSN